jgi:hypothetical protein
VRNNIYVSVAPRNTEMRVESLTSFFKRGRGMARAADRGDRIEPRKIVAFEDPRDLLRYLRTKRER